MGDERMFPIQSERGAKAHPREIPWSVAERAYSVYAAKWSSGQTLERLAERGGFAPSEMDEFLPGWREEVSELSRLRAELAALTQRPTEAERDAAESELLASRAVEDRNEAQAREAEARSALSAALARADEAEKRAAERDATSAIVMLDAQLAEARSALAATEQARQEAERRAACSEKDAQILDDAAMKFAIERNEARAALAAARAEGEARGNALGEAIQSLQTICNLTSSGGGKERAPGRGRFATYNQIFQAATHGMNRARALSGPSATTGGED